MSPAPAAFRAELARMLAGERVDLGILAALARCVLRLEGVSS